MGDQHNIIKWDNDETRNTSDMYFNHIRVLTIVSYADCEGGYSYEAVCHIKFPITKKLYQIVNENYYTNIEKAKATLEACFMDVFTHIEDYSLWIKKLALKSAMNECPILEEIQILEAIKK